ncbi:MAG: ATP-binding protein [Candidatus Woesearchaeota archaeon]
MDFKNRKKELNLLNELYKQDSSKLIIFYGRRRVGKSELLNQFIKKNNGIYLLFNQESLKDQLRHISNQLAIQFNDDFLKVNPFSNFESLLVYLSKYDLPIVFDEFPYLVDSSKSILSILQNYWDINLSKKKTFLILCGSSIAIMEGLLSKKSPIYGRRTEQILLEPLSFEHSCLFFNKNLDIKNKIIFYSILGGMPAYLLEFDYNKSIKYNLINNILKKNKYLYQDVLFSLKEELNDPKNYFSILASISKGNSKLNEIVNDTGFEKTFVNKYLSVLINLQLVERIVPITEKNTQKSRKGIYRLKELYFKFWFRFIFGNEIYIEQNKQEKLVDEIIIPNLNSYVGLIFEDIVLQKLIQKYDNYLFGKHWDKNLEIDVVGLDKKNKNILFGEVKFKELNENEIKNHFFNLKEKSKSVIMKNFNKNFIIIFIKNNQIVFIDEKNNLFY